MDKIPYWLRSTLKYPSNIWRWPFALCVRLPLFLTVVVCRWIVETLDNNAHRIPTIKYEDTDHG